MPKIARLEGFTHVALTEQEPLAVGRGEVRVRIEQSGLCGSELDLYRDRAFWRDVDSGRAEVPPIGHEAAGFVIEVGEDVADLHEGDRVALWLDPPSGFAEETVVPAAHCIRVSSTMAYPALAEPLGCVVNSVEKVAPRIGDDVVILGTGAMAQMLVAVSALKGPRSLTVVGRRGPALSLAMALGATEVVNTTEDSPVDVVREIVGLDGADVTYEAWGVQEGLDLAVELTRRGTTGRPGGKIGLVGYHRVGRRSLDLGLVNAAAINPVNCHFRDTHTIFSGMRVGMRMVEAGRLDVDRVVTAQYPLERIDEAFAVATGRPKPEGLVKAMIVIR